MRLAFVGWAQPGCAVLDALLKSRHDVVQVVTAPEPTIGPASVVGLAAARGVPVLADAATDDSGWTFGTSAAADLIVVVGWPTRLPPALTAVAGLSAIAVHDIPLPGRRKLERTAGQSRWEVTAQFVRPSFSWDDVLLQRRAVLPAGETAAAVRRGEAFVEIAIAALDLLDAEAEPEPCGSPIGGRAAVAR